MRYTVNTMSHQEQVNQAIEAAFQTAERVFGRSFPRPRVSFDIKYGSNRAGDASYVKNLIRINRQLLNQNPTEIIEQTCPHEAAHLIAYHLYGTKAWNHGPYWKQVMRALGKSPDRCHELVTVSFLRKPVYQCNYCNRQGPISPTLHNRVVSGRASLKRCKCGGQYSFVGTGNQVVKNGELNCRKAPEQGNLAQNSKK